MIFLYHFIIVSLYHDILYHFIIVSLYHGIIILYYFILYYIIIYIYIYNIIFFILFYIILYYNILYYIILLFLLWLYYIITLYLFHYITFYFSRIPYPISHIYLRINSPSFFLRSHRSTRSPTCAGSRAGTSCSTLRPMSWWSLALSQSLWGTEMRQKHVTNW